MFCVTCSVSRLTECVRRRDRVEIAGLLLTTYIVSRDLKMHLLVLWFTGKRPTLSSLVKFFYVENVIDGPPTTWQVADLAFGARFFCLANASCCVMIKQAATRPRLLIGEIYFSKIPARSPALFYYYYFIIWIFCKFPLFFSSFLH